MENKYQYSTNFFFLRNINIRLTDTRILFICVSFPLLQARPNLPIPLPKPNPPAILTRISVHPTLRRSSPFRCSATRPCECGAATVATPNSCRGTVGDRRPEYRRAPAARGPGLSCFFRAASWGRPPPPHLTTCSNSTIHGIDYPRLAGADDGDSDSRKSIPNYALLQRLIRRLGFVPARWPLIKAEGVGARSGKWDRR